LFLPQYQLYTHGWDANNDTTHPRVFWGRANGWCLMAMAELLTVLPEDHPARPEVLKVFRQHAQGIASLQSGIGLWHQLLDRNDSYLETSASAMFTYALARGCRMGWLDPAVYGPTAIAGWNGVASRITADGHVDGTCIGTTFAADYIYYYNRPMIDDIHGYGPTLLAGSEILNFINDRRFRIVKMKNQPIVVRAWPSGRASTMTNDAEPTTQEAKEPKEPKEAK